MMLSERPVILIECCNGLQFEEFYRDVLVCNKVIQFFDVRRPSVRECTDVIVFGPYGSDIPSTGDYLRVGYICENYVYDGPPCDFVFTVSDQVISHTPSARIQWHGFDPETLIKSSHPDPEQILRSKSRFCNFLYSNRVSYREDFFKLLSKYRPVDAPGSSMHNMPSIDEAALPGESRWETKRRFLSQYKFTLALENEVFPGYQTEKLFDGMRANSMPVYIGDSNVNSVFNPQSFVSSAGEESSYWLSRLRDYGQFRWAEVHGPSRLNLDNRLRRHLRLLLRDARHRVLISKYIQSLINEIIDLDQNDDKYLSKMQEPWLRENLVAAESYSLLLWKNIFSRIPARTTMPITS